MKAVVIVTSVPSNLSKFETIHKIFAGPMGIIPKVRNTIREKKMYESVT